MSAPWYRYDAATRTLLLSLHVQPNARASGFAGLHGDALRVRVGAPAVDDKANAALVAFLGRALQAPSRAITIRHGLRGRRKTVAIAPADPGMVSRLEALAAAAGSP